MSNPFRDEVSKGLIETCVRLGLRPASKATLVWPIDTGFDGVLIPSWHTEARSKSVLLDLYVGVIDLELEAEVKRRRIATSRGLATIQELIMNLVPGRRGPQGLSQIVFQPGLDNDWLLDWVAEIISTIGMSWAASHASREAITAAIFELADTPGYGASPHLAVRAPLLAYMRGDRVEAQARLERHLQAFASRDDGDAVGFRAFASKLRAELAGLASSG